MMWQKGDTGAKAWIQNDSRAGKYECTRLYNKNSGWAAAYRPCQGTSHAGSSTSCPCDLQPQAASPMSESSALQQKLLGFCQAGRVLNSEEVAENEQLAEFVKWHLRQCAHRLLEESKHRPVLFAYSSDATPVLTQTSAVLQALLPHPWWFGGAKS